MSKTEELKAAFSQVRKLDEAIDRKLDEHFLMALIDTTKWELEQLRRRRGDAERQLRELGRQSNVVLLRPWRSAPAAASAAVPVFAA